jgi:hypothetical protein
MLSTRSKVSGHFSGWPKSHAERGRRVFAKGEGPCCWSGLGVEIDDFFQGSALNAVDAKGRLSVPAFVRSVIERRSDARAIVIGAHEVSPCLTAYGRGYARNLYEEMERRRLVEEGRGGTLGRALRPRPPRLRHDRGRPLRHQRPDRRAADDAPQGRNRGPRPVRRRRRHGRDLEPAHRAQGGRPRPEGDRRLPNGRERPQAHEPGRARPARPGPPRRGHRRPERRSGRDPCRRHLRRRRLYARHSR